MLFAAAMLAVTLLSCNKKFDEPPTDEEPNVTPTLTIQALKAMHNMGNVDAVTTDDIIAGIVIADDKSGNFYKQLVIQDETGGIAIRMDGLNLFTDYPTGRKIFVKLKGLYLGDYNGSIQLGGGIDNSNPSSLNVTGIASNLFGKYIIKGSTGNKVEPQVVTVSELNDAYQNTLIELEGFQFASADTSKTFGDATLASSARNFTLKNCANHSITLRTSSYADFAGINVPNGNGNLTAVYTVFGSTKQLYVRDTADVKFTGKRCDAIAATLTNISQVRTMFTGTAVLLPDAIKIKGVVISDRPGGNINTKNLVLQQTGGSGIVIRCTEPHSYNMGDELEVNISNLSLEEFSGTLQINNVPAENILKTGTGTIIPKVTTTTDLKANFETMESTLVTLQRLKITGGVNGSWNGVTTLTDKQGAITCTTLNTASFSNNLYPTGEVVSFTGIVTQLNADKQVNLRNASDVVADSSVETGASLLISEYVEGSSNNKYLELYNAGDNAIQLADYTLKLYKNGSADASSTIKLSTLTNIPPSMAAGAVLVLKYTSANLTLPTGVVAYNSAVCGFNGDDAIILEKNGQPVDVFGEPGNDPGTSWTIAGNDKACIDKSLRRKKSVKAGNTNWTNAAAFEWEIGGNGKDDVSDLGNR